MLCVWLVACSDGVSTDLASTNGTPPCPATGHSITRGSETTDIDVDFARPEEVPTLSGVIHGITESTPPEAVTGIQLVAWRGRSGAVQAAAYVEAPVLVVSDYVRFDGSPANDWSAYEAQVRELTQMHGTSVVYDIWNEPDNPFFWPWWPGVPFGGPEDTAEYLESFRRAHDVIRAELGEEAIIAGPSYTMLSERLIRTFMDYCLEQGLKVQVLAVHVLYAHDRSFPEVARTLARLRAHYVDAPTYAAVGIEEIHVNEYGAPKQFGRPGSMLTLIRFMEQVGVSEAMRADWGPARQYRGDLHGYLVFAGLAEPIGDVDCSNCDSYLADLLTEDDLRPRAIWWAYKHYADGSSSRVEAHSSIAYIMPIASRGSEHLEGGQVLLAAYDSESYPDGPASVSVRLRNMGSLRGVSTTTRRVTVRLERIPYDDDTALEAPVFTTECSLAVDADDEVLFSVEMPEDYGVHVLSLQD